MATSKVKKDGSIRLDMSRQEAKQLLRICDAYKEGTVLLFRALSEKKPGDHFFWVDDGPCMRTLREALSEEE